MAYCKKTHYAANPHFYILDNGLKLKLRLLQRRRLPSPAAKRTICMKSFVDTQSENYRKKICQERSF